MSLKGFLKNNYLPRYTNQYGMEQYPCTIDVQSGDLGYPYGDFSKGLFREGKYSFDKNGVFIFYGNKAGENYYNPCGIAEYALVCWGRMLNDKKHYNQYLSIFKKQINWLVINHKAFGKNKVIWYYNYPNQKPFFSGISQGMIISALLRAYQLDNNEEYIQLAIKAYNFLNTKVEQGGVLFTSQPFDWWYEEYLNTPKILNGHIYALLGIWDLYRVTSDKKVKASFYKGISAIKNNIKKFDLGFYTKYDAYSRYPANNSYHYTHITLFNILYNITKDNFFKKYANKFNKYHKQFIYKTLNLLYLLIIVIIDKFRKQ